MIILASCNSPENANISSSSSYQNTKTALEEKEKLNPTDFLKVEGTFRQNLVHRWVLEGKVTNIATVAKYKDAVLKIAYYSKTKTELGSEEKTLFEFVNLVRARVLK